MHCRGGMYGNQGGGAELVRPFAGQHARLHLARLLTLVVGFASIPPTGKGAPNMKPRMLTCAVLVLTSLSLSPRVFRAQSATSSTDPYLTAHEWGTFASIAGKDGRAVQWLPLTGSTDLPS